MKMHYLIIKHDVRSFQIVIKTGDITEIHLDIIPSSVTFTQARDNENPSLSDVRLRFIMTRANLKCVILNRKIFPFPPFDVTASSFPLLRTHL